MKYNKLVRDKIPEIIKQKGGVFITHIAEDEEYWQKLLEEMEEFADLLEVIDAIADYKKFDRNEMTKIREKKAAERGTFKARIILDESQIAVYR